MATVSLEALSRGVVPEPDFVVEGGGEDVLPVWRELCVGRGSAGVADEGAETLACRGVPHADETVKRGRDNEGPVAVEGDRDDGIRVGRESLETPSCPSVPHADGLVIRARHNEPPH